MPNTLDRIPLIFPPSPAHKMHNFLSDFNRVIML